MLSKIKSESYLSYLEIWSEHYTCDCGGAVCFEPRARYCSECGKELDWSEVLRNRKEKNK